MYGTVKKYFSQKGFGFISPDSGDADIFVHRSALLFGVIELREGQRVTFKVEETDKGLKAVKVEVIKNG